MIKINIKYSTKENFYIQVMSNFFNDVKKKPQRLIKKQDKKIILDKSLLQINNLIKKKLKDFQEDINLEKLILLEYEDLKKLVEYIDNHKKFTDLSKNEKDIFLTLYARLNNVEFIKELDVNVCPYCNRNYIFNFSKNNSEQATAQLDHFFDKKSYPYLAVSLYNLVPSCGTCNQRKSSKNENIFYPYNESFNDNAKFVYKGIRADNKTTFLDSSRIMFEIQAINTSQKEKVKKHIEVFNLKNLYDEHKDVISELLQKREIYSDSYIDELLNKYEGTLFKNREDLLRLITCGYVNDEDINKRPLSKLTKDISEELGLL